MREQRPRVRGLLVDYGGVLTRSLDDTMRAWAAVDAVDLDHFGELLREWLTGPHENPVHGLETGRLSTDEFERILAARLRRRDGGDLAAPGLLTRMFAHLTPSSGMAGVVRRARRRGVRTALLSNSWGIDYPRQQWDQLFDAVVISGEVGMRKPDPEIYLHTAGLLGLEPAECVFVDDLPHNVAGAVAVGMTGVRHVDLDVTIAELEAFLGVDLRHDGAEPAPASAPGPTGGSGPRSAPATHEPDTTP